MFLVYTWVTASENLTEFLQTVGLYLDQFICEFTKHTVIRTVETKHIVAVNTNIYHIYHIFSLQPDTCYGAL